jgi:hypothetical protein
MKNIRRRKHRNYFNYQKYLYYLKHKTLLALHYLWRIRAHLYSNSGVSRRKARYSKSKQTKAKKVLV